MLLLPIMGLAAVVVLIAYQTRQIHSVNQAVTSGATLVVFGLASIGMASLGSAEAWAQQDGENESSKTTESTEQTASDADGSVRPANEDSGDSTAVQKESDQASEAETEDGAQPVTVGSDDERAAKDSQADSVAVDADDESTKTDEDGAAVADGPNPNDELADESLPTWISLGGDARAYHDGDVEYKVIEAGPYSQVQLCEHELDQSMLLATRNYIDETVGYDGAWKAISVDLNQIRRELQVPDKNYTRWRNYTIGPMCWKYTLLSFDEPFRREVLTRWEQHRKVARLQQSGLAFGVLMGLMTIAFGYLKLDHATRGFYSGRLQMLAVAAILAIVVGGAFVARAIYWT